VSEEMTVNVGMDLGTTSVACFWLDGNRMRTLIPKGVEFPACAAQLGSKLLVGSDARNVREESMARYEENLKRRVRKSETLGVRTISFLSAIVDKARTIVEREAGQKIGEVTVGVPNQFGILDRRAYRMAFHASLLDKLRLVSEPVAAIIGYQYRQPRPLEGTIMILDYGGGTTDISLGLWSGRSFQLLFSHGDSQMGGRDLDRVVLDLLRRGYLDATGTHFPLNLRLAKLRGDPQYYRLRELAESWKCLLSEREEILIAESFGEIELPNILLKRSDFEREAADEFARVRNLCLWTIQQAGLSVNEIEYLILTGGSSRIPRLQQELASLFQEGKTQIHYEREMATKCVGEGLAVLAAKRDLYEIKEIFSHDIGFLAPVIADNALIPLIRKGDTKPLDDLVERSVAITETIDISPADVRRFRLALMERFEHEGGGVQLDPLLPVFSIDLYQTAGVTKEHYHGNIQADMILLPATDEVELSFSVEQVTLETTEDERVETTGQYVEAEAARLKLEEAENLAISLGPEKGRGLHDVMEQILQRQVEIDEYLDVCDVIEAMRCEANPMITRDSSPPPPPEADL